MKCLLLILAVLPLLHCAMVDKILNQGAKTFQASKSGKMIRECNCQEQRTCVEAMKGEIQQCFDGCWGKVKMVASNPGALKQCYQSKQYIIENMLMCMQGNLDSCVDKGERAMVPHVDIRAFIEKGEDQIQASARTFMNAFSSGKELVQTAVEVGSCVKECFMQKNAGGFCFDKHGCQPKIEVGEAKSELKKCMRQIQWQKQAADLCQCSMKAGVTSVGDFCKMLHTLSNTVQGHH